MIWSALGGGPQPSLAHELGEELRVVHDLVAAAEVRVLVRERVEAVRAAGDDLRHARLVQRRDVLLREGLEDVLVPHPARRVSGARLARAEDRDVDPGGEQQLHRRLGGEPGPFVERRGAADPVENLRRAASGREDAHAEALGPRGALVLWLAPRIAAALDVAQHRLGLGREARLDHDEVPSQVDDVVDMLDRDRALLDACAAGHAVPDDLVRDRIRDERRRVERAVSQHLRTFGEDVVAEIHDQELRRELLAGRVRRADVLAAPALGARHRVEDPLPGDVRDRARAEADLLVRRVEVQRLEMPTGARAPEEDVRAGGRDVQVLRVGQVDEEREDDQHVAPRRRPARAPRSSSSRRRGPRARSRAVTRSAGHALKPSAIWHACQKRSVPTIPAMSARMRSASPRWLPLKRGGCCALRIQNAAATPTSTSAQKRSTRSANQPWLSSHVSGDPEKVRLAVDDVDQRDQDRREEDDEAPEDERVHEPGAEPLEELPLAEDDRRLVLDALREVVEALERSCPCGSRRTSSSPRRTNSVIATAAIAARASAESQVVMRLSLS